EAEVDGQRLSSAEVLGFVQLLIAAGQETTANLIDNMMLALMENPGELELPAIERGVIAERDRRGAAVPLPAAVDHARAAARCGSTRADDSGGKAGAGGCGIG